MKYVVWLGESQTKTLLWRLEKNSYFIRSSTGRNSLYVVSICKLVWQICKHWRFPLVYTWKYAKICLISWNCAECGIWLFKVVIIFLFIIFIMLVKKNNQAKDSMSPIEMNELWRMTFYEIEYYTETLLWRLWKLTV